MNYFTTKLMQFEFNEKALRTAVQIGTEQYLVAYDRDYELPMSVGSLSVLTAAFDIRDPEWVSRVLGTEEYDPETKTHCSLMSVSDNIDSLQLEAILLNLKKVMPIGSSVAFWFNNSKYSYGYIEQIMSECGYLIYEHTDYNACLAVLHRK